MDGQVVEDGPAGETSGGSGHRQDVFDTCLVLETEKDEERKGEREIRRLSLYVVILTVESDSGLDRLFFGHGRSGSYQVYSVPVHHHTSNLSTWDSKLYAT